MTKSLEFNKLIKIESSNLYNANFYCPYYQNSVKLLLNYMLKSYIKIAWNV